MGQDLGSLAEEYFFLDPSSGEVCISTSLSVVMYTGVTFLSVMFVVIANQLIAAKQQKAIDDKLKRERANSIEKQLDKLVED